jgi:DNA polymerase-3 subunit delta'
LQPFFGLAAGASGWRIAIVDAADELNRNAANALLKALEEPPQRAVLLLVAHAPGRTLATIRSRCRKLALKSLTQDEIAQATARLAATHQLGALSAEDETLIATLADGSLGRALELRLSGGLAHYRALQKATRSWPNISEGAIQTLLDATLSRTNGDAFNSISRLMVDLVRAAARGALQAGRAELSIAHLATGAPPHAWADLAGDLEALFAKASGLNLDERAVIGEAMRRIAAVRRGAAATAA